MVSRGPEVNRKQRNKDAKSICWQVTLSTTLDMLLLGAATIIWFVTVRSGTCLFTTRATCRSHNDAYEATTVAPGHFVIDKTYAPPFFSSPSLCDLEPRRHLVSATVLDLWRNESLHMPVFSCRAVQVKKKKERKKERKVVLFPLLLPAKMNVSRMLYPGEFYCQTRNYMQ